MTTAYETMIAEAARTGLPKSFVNDLTVHDQNRLTGDDAPDRFGWVLRACGTLLLDARMSNQNRRDYLGHITSSGKGSADRCYFWNGRELDAVTAEEMGRRMAQFAEDAAAAVDLHGRY